jgi:hypothetical protein
MQNGGARKAGTKGFWHLHAVGNPVIGRLLFFLILQPPGYTKPGQESKHNNRHDGSWQSNKKEEQAQTQVLTKLRAGLRTSGRHFVIDHRFGKNPQENGPADNDRRQPHHGT